MIGGISTTETSLKEEIGDQEAQQAKTSHHLERHSGLALCVCLLHSGGGSLSLAAGLTLAQALVCESVLKALNLCSRIRELGLQIVTGGSIRDNRLNSGESGGLGGRGRFSLGLLGEFGGRNGRSLVGGGLFGSRSFEVCARGGVGRGLIVKVLEERVSFSAKYENSHINIPTRLGPHRWVPTKKHGSCARQQKT